MRLWPARQSRSKPPRVHPAPSRAQHGLDDYQTIQCINYIRAAVRDGQDPRVPLNAGERPFLEERFFQPVLEDDALLFHDFTTDTQLGCAVSHPRAPLACPAAADPSAQRPGGEPRGRGVAAVCRE